MFDCCKIHTYKICHNLYDPITTKSLLTINKSNTRSHNYKLVKPRVNSSQFMNFFTNHIINLWNNLPKVGSLMKKINILRSCWNLHFWIQQEKPFKKSITFVWLSFLVFELLKFLWRKICLNKPCKKLSIFRSFEEAIFHFFYCRSSTMRYQSEIFTDYV